METNNDKESENILYLGFNQDYGCFSCGTESGFRIFNSTPFVKAFSRDLGGGISLVEMLYRCNILGLVGGGKNPKYPLNKVMLWDDHQTKCIGEMSFKSEIKALKLRPNRVVVALENKIFLYNFSDLKLIENFETNKNEKGLVSINTEGESTILAYPDKEMGVVAVNFTNNQKFTRVEAHKNPLSAIELNPTGKKLATCSENGKLIRIFSTNEGALLQELRRGLVSVIIYSISFDLNDKWLACSSDSKTIHIFSLNNEENTQKHEENSKNKKNFLTRDEKSFAQFKINDTKSKVAFGNEPNTIVVISTLGNYFLAKFNPETGGECEKIDSKNIFDE